MPPQDDATRARAAAMAARIRTPRILWGAMLVSAGIYAGLIVSDVIPVEPGTEPMPLPLLIGAAAACAIASFVVPRLMHRQAIAKATFAIDELPLSTAPTGYRSAGERFLQLASAAYDTAFAVWFMPFVASLALSEAIAAFGLVGAVTGQPPAHCLPFIGVSALLIALRFPTWRAVITPVEKHTGAAAAPMG